MYDYCLYCYFFVVKQKTAYEMRISDWSSDVCSSDLPINMRDTQSPESIQRSIDYTQKKLDEAKETISYYERVGAQKDLSWEQSQVEQIGRASCRERVCQYV